jgi:predicted transcriptional regulator
MQVQLATRISYNLAVKLEEYAKSTGKSKASIIEAALREYLDKQARP